MRLISFRLVFGLFLLLLGVSIILSRVFGFDISTREIWQYWPVIPLLLGLNWMVLSVRPYQGEGRRVFFSWGQFFTGLLAAALGAVYLAKKLMPDRFDFDAAIIWSVLGALLLIFAGYSLMRGRTATGDLGKVAFMGGINAGGSKPWKLESGSYIAFMGGIDLDLTTAEIAPGETVLDLTAVMGGIDVKVPRDLAVTYEGSSILGGVTFKGQEDGGIIASRKVEENLEGAERVVRIQARAIMGGIDIKEKF
jgi:predicted membrane protein